MRIKVPEKIRPGEKAYRNDLHVVPNVITVVDISLQPIMGFIFRKFSATGSCNLKKPTKNWKSQHLFYGLGKLARNLLCVKKPVRDNRLNPITNSKEIILKSGFTLSAEINCFQESSWDILVLFVRSIAYCLRDNKRIGATISLYSL